MGKQTRLERVERGGRGARAYLEISLLSLPLVASNILWSLVLAAQTILVVLIVDDVIVVVVPRQQLQMIFGDQIEVVLLVKMGEKLGCVGDLSGGCGGGRVRQRYREIDFALDVGVVAVAGGHFGVAAEIIRVVITVPAEIGAIAALALDGGREMAGVRRGLVGADARRRGVRGQRRRRRGGRGGARRQRRHGGR